MRFANNFIALLVTQKSLFTVTHALFFIYNIYIYMVSCPTEYMLLQCYIKFTHCRYVLSPTNWKHFIKIMTCSWVSVPTNSMTIRSGQRRYLEDCVYFSRRSYFTRSKAALLSTIPDMCTVIFLQKFMWTIVRLKVSRNHEGNIDIHWSIYFPNCRNILTQSPLMSHICVSESGQHWFR